MIKQLILPHSSKDPQAQPGNSALFIIGFFSGEKKLLGAQVIIQVLLKIFVILEYKYQNGRKVGIFCMAVLLLKYISSRLIFITDIMVVL